MGFNKKRWLALALTIIMVLGMGVPTAFAEGATAKYFLGTSQDLFFPTSADDDYLIIGAEGPAATISLSESGTVSFMVKEIDPNFYLGYRYVPFTATEFTLTAGNGSFTVTPHSMTDNAGKTFLVIVDPSDPADDDWYEAEFTVYVRPVLQANKSIVELDKDDTKSMQSTTIGFTAKNAVGKTLVMDNMGRFEYYRADGDFVTRGGSGVLTSTETMLNSDVKRATTTSNFFTYTLSSNLLTPSRAGEGYILFTGEVDGVPTMPLKVPYKVSDSRLVGNNRPYRVGASISDVTIDRNRQISDITFEPFYYDATGKQVYPARVVNPSDTTLDLEVRRGSIRAVSLDEDLVMVSNYDTTTGKFTLEWPDISVAKHSGSTEILIYTEGVLNGKLKVTVNPIYVTPSPLTFTLNRAKGGQKTQNVKLATTGTTGDNVVGFTVTPSTSTVAVTAQNANNVDIGLGGTGTGDGKLTFSDIILMTGIGPIPVPDCAVDYHVVNNGVTRAMTAKFALNDAPLTGFTLDTASFATNTVSLVFTPVAMTGEANKFDQTAPRYDEVTIDGFPGWFTLGQPTILADGSLKYVITATRWELGTFDVTFGGTLDGNPITPITVPITIKNGTANMPNSIVAGATVINKLTSDEYFTVNYELKDANGNAILAGATPPSPWSTDGLYGVNVEIVSPNRQTQDVVRVMPFLSDDTWISGSLRKIEFATTGAIGTSTVILSDPNGRYPSTSFVVNVNPITFTTSTTSVTLDMASTNTKDITLTPVNGFGLFRTGGIWLPAGSTGPATVSVVSTNQIRLTGTAIGKGTLRIYSYAETGSTAYEFVDIEVNVVNSQAIKVTPERFDFNLAAGGIVTGTLAVTGNPTSIGLTNIRVNSSDSNVVTATNNGNDTWKIDAQGVGTAILTVYGTDAQGNDWAREVPVTVVNTTAKPKITATPAAVVLDIKEGAGQKLEETLTFSGANATDTVVITSIVCGNSSIATVTNAAPYTVKAVAKGSTTIEVKGTVNGLEADPLYVSVTVNDGTIVIASGFYIDDATAPLNASTSVVNRVGYVKCPPVKVTKTAANTHIVTCKDAAGNKLAITSAVPKSTKNLTAKANADGTATVVIKNTASTTVTFTVAGATYPIRIGGKVEKITGINKDATDITMMVGQRLNVNPSFTPAFANNQGVTYKTGDAKTAKVSNGVLTALKAGTTTLTITSKAKSSIKSKVTVTVLDDYKSVVYRSAYLGDNGMAAVLSAATFNGTTNAAVALPGTSKAAFVAKLNEFAADTTIKQNDVFAFYLSGTATSSGLALGTDVISFDDLAKELSKIEGNIFLMMDCAQSSRVINTKSLSEAEINNELISAFAKANVSVQAKTVATATSNDKAKFKILTSTVKKAQKTNSTVFAEYLVKALTAVEGKFPADKNSDTKVTLTELYDYMVANANKAAKAAGDSQRVGVYPASDKFPVYAQATAPVAP